MKSFSNLTPGDFYNFQQGKVSSYIKCYEKHPPLALGEFTVYGSSCHTPNVKDADIYVGLDHSMKHSPKTFPWTEGHSFLFPIIDTHAPHSSDEFAALMKFLEEEIRKGKKVHIGCVGGHGRTGLVLAALVRVFLGVEDAITYVRQHYCVKAVETNEQVDFLHTHYGITKVSGTKSHTSHSYGKSKIYYADASQSVHPKIAHEKFSLWGDSMRLTIG